MVAARGAFRLISRTGLSGGLELEADVGSDGRTRLSRQSFRAPVHLSKPFWDAGALVLNIVSPTAGLLEGDRVQTDVTVAAGARLVLTTPAATRLHTMRGGMAKLTQTYRVEGALEFWPELLIPQRGTRYEQRTSIHLSTNAELLYFEMLAPGRTAGGESFAYDEIVWAMDLFKEGVFAARERYRLTPLSTQALRKQFPFAYYGSALICSPALAPNLACWQELENLHEPECWVGVSALRSPGAYALKIVAADTLLFRKTMRAAREILYRALGRAAPDLRRTG